MTDTPPASEPAGTIDPKRPWITDPRDAPAHMNWLETLTNPTGKTSRVHFTRAWTALFFTRLIYFIGTLTLAGIFAAAGSSFSLPGWVWPVLVVITAILSLIVHIRRLSDAGRSPLWATLVIVPILFGFAAFLGGAAMGGAQYEQTLAARQAGPPASDTPSETQAADAQSTADAGADDDEANSETAGRGERQRRGPQVNVAEISQREHAFNTGLGLAQIAWAPLSFFVMLWSLLWVGRLPTGGGTIRSRFADQSS